MKPWLDCREVTRLAQLPQEQPPTLYQRLSMRLHRLICAPCRFYQRQLAAMAAAAQTLGEAGEHNEPAATLDEQARARISARLRAAVDKKP